MLNDNKNKYYFCINVKRLYTITLDKKSILSNKTNTRNKQGKLQNIIINCV